MVGHGRSAGIEKADYRPRSEFRLRPIVNAYTCAGPASAAYADNLFIASAGMPIFGRPAPTRMRIGTAPAWLRGNSGTLRALKHGYCGACKAVAARQPAGVSGKTPRSITVSRYFGCGATIAMRRGRRFWRIGDCQTFRSSIARATSRSARLKRATDRLRALPSRNWPDCGDVVRLKARQSTPPLVPSFIVLAPNKFWRPLLIEGFDALLEIFRLTQPAITMAFQLDSNRERRIFRIVQKLLRGPLRQR